MDKVFIIKEKNNPFSRERIVCSFTDEEVAKKYCRDMRTDGELYYDTINLNPCTLQDISAEKIYQIQYKIDWYFNEDTPEIDVYNDLMKVEPVTLVAKEHLFSVANASLRSVRLNSDVYGTTFSFWCYAKDAPAAMKIMKRTLKSFDPSILEWGKYCPMSKNDKELNKRVNRFNEKKKKK